MQIYAFLLATEFPAILSGNSLITHDFKNVWCVTYFNKISKATYQNNKQCLTFSVMGIHFNQKKMPRVKRCSIFTLPIVQRLKVIKFVE
jgi:hypothetical protein